MTDPRRTARILIDRHGRTYAAEAGIRLRDTPSPLYRLAVLSSLLSARIGAGIAVAAARALSDAGYRSARAMRDASWQDRVDALGRGHYRRYDERTATMLGNGAELILDRWKGDLRALHAEGGDVHGVTNLLQEIPGIGPTGAAIFCREVQGVWPDLAPYVDERTAEGAERLGLPRAPERLRGLVDASAWPRLVAACVRASLSKDVVTDVLRQ
ncbi:MAG TPA: endonuclease [Actinopolymorphaceae bacterium]